ncbi:PAS domain-containing protein [Nafulsella turpanensis]|uniref:PAS domain-containing protein n=1 Tax=Nafulsella turpanensis TaxID=1265690 RepID=UPI00034C4959|nr:PAS domain-containing sensor histidine kinase [Nafulsella turpanensis]
MASSKQSSKDKPLRQSQYQQSFLQQLADFTPELLFVIDLNSHEILYVNSRVEYLLGHDANYIYDKGSDIFKMLVHPQDYELRMANLEACRQLPDHNEKVVEVRLKLAGRDWNWFRIKDKVFKRDAEGQVVQTIGIAQNIHEQKLAEKKLQEEHRRFKDAQAIGHIGSFERNLPGDMVYCSDEFFRIHGLEPQAEPMSTEKFMSFIHPDDVDECMEAIRHSHKTGEPFDLINRIIRPDGSVRYVHRRAALSCNEKGIPLRVYGTLQDITEQKKTEEEVLRLKDELTQQLSNRYRTLFDSIDEGFCILEVVFSEEKESSEKQVADYRFIDTNPAFEKYSGIKNAPGKSLAELLPDISFSRFANYGQVALTGEPMRFEDYVAATEKWFDISIFRIGAPEDRQVAVLFNDITDRKRHEEVLRESEERFRLMADTIPQIIWITDAEGRAEFLNKQWSAYSGVLFEPTTAAEIAANFIHPEDAPKVMAAFNEAMQTGNSMEVEQRTRSATGEYRWFLNRANPYRDPKTGKISRWFGASTDIHDRKLAEESLHRSKKRLQKAISIKTVGITFFDLEGKIYDANKAFQQMSGYSHEDFISGKVRWDKATPPEFMEATLKAREELLSEGQNTPYEKQYFRPDGSRWWGLFAGKRLSENECVGFVVDIGKQKRAEQQLKEFNNSLEQQVAERTHALQENVHFIQKIADITPDILFVYDLEQMRLKYINRDLYSLLGKSLKTLRAMPPEVLFSLLHPDDRESAQTFTQSFEDASDEELKEIELRLQNRQREWRWFHCRTRVFKRNEEGKVVQLLSIMRDVTEEKNTTKALLEAEKLSVKGTMARTIAHEVRGPAANIALSMEIIQKELEQELKGKEDALVYFDIVLKSCHRISNYINELLNISVAEPGAFIESDLAVLAEEVLNQAQDRIFLKEIRVERHFSKGCIVHADRERLKVAFLNIIMNAIEAMEEQKGILALSVRQQNDKILLSVQDNGCGMTKEQLSKMFDAYYTSKPKGMGVGLANVKAILQDHSANIKVESEPGKGTNFTVIFTEQP